jgi:mono/diheme cytochrome c family protein
MPLQSPLRCAAIALAMLCLLTANRARGSEIVFARDVLPILSDTCFQCHGPDAKNRQAELRLDVRDVALSELPSGSHAIVPGNLEESELIRRIEATGDEVMPPAKSLKQLTAAQKQTLSRWISEGAKFQTHWAYTPPRRPELPAVKQEAWVRNPIDRFVLARLEKETLSPSPEAAKGTLLRRVSLDLTGLPPTPAELTAFVADQSPDAYEKVVDRLLASPRFGERLATVWLDVARYADTNGYNNDEDRIMWRWRDWVIEAFNRNLPFDQFSVEQLAGDLLPNPTLDQRIATGFNRNHVFTTEGGIINEEYRVEYVADRVQTTANVFLGLTVQCARCHDHKFDPITQREYYQFFAFFNQSSDTSLGYNNGAPATPFMKAPTREQEAKQAVLATQRQEVASRLEARAAQIAEPLAKWEQGLPETDRAYLDAISPAVRFSLDEKPGEETFTTVLAQHHGAVHGAPTGTEGKIGPALAFDGQSYLAVGEAFAFDRSDKVSYGAWVNRTGNTPITVLSKMHDSQGYRGFDLIIEAGKVAVHMVHRWPDNAIKVITKTPVPASTWHHVWVTYDGSSHAAGIKIYVDGISQPLDVVEDRLSDTIVTEWPLHLGSRGEGLGFVGKIDDIRFNRTDLAADDVARLVAGAPDDNLSAALKVPVAERTAEQQAAVRRYFIERVDEPSKAISTELASVEQLQRDLDKAIPTTLVMDEIPTPRETHILNRGQYDQPTDLVSAGTPASLPPLAGDHPKNRLGLARWLVDPGHPLTSRVAVNRWWSMLFGSGLVETEEDLGVQGSWPSHPDLLDWLALQYSLPVGEGPGDHGLGWDTKALIRLIATSATYRQASQVSPALAERDPHNHLLARGPRFRLSAEAMRDTALAIAGLLVERIGGPSVMPYQPAGLWEDVSVERRFTYKQAHDEGLYRRSMYTFWKRTCPPPTMNTFDAPDREVCVVRRARTNTPLQALVLMNDTTYVEAARKFAERVLCEGGSNTSERLRYAYQVAMAREPQPAEIAVLEPMHGAAMKRFTEDPAAATKLLAVGDAKADANLNQAELAAWSVVASMLLNLDETISKE